MTATAIYLTDDTDLDHDGDEALVHHVYAGDDDGEPVGTVYTVRRGFDAAFELAERMARDRGVELVTG